MDVYLNVYHLAGYEQHNEYMGWMGAGFFHSGVQIDIREFSFSQTGICITSPQLPVFGRLKERHLIGVYVKTKSDLNNSLARLAAAFSSGSYDLVHKNCNNFSEALCLELLGLSIPAYVNRAASVGGALSGGSTGTGTNTSTSTTTNNNNASSSTTNSKVQSSAPSTGGLAMLGIVKAPSSSSSSSSSYSSSSSSSPAIASDSGRAALGEDDLGLS
jgi:hypothetical protein